MKREKLYSRIDRKRKTLVADIEKVSKKIDEIIHSTATDLIVEGHFAVDVVPPEKISIVFVLRRDPKDLEKNLKRRSYSEEKIKENVAAEILDACLYNAIKTCGEDKVCEINVTSRNVEDVVQEIIKVINGEEKCKIGIVDWLEKLEAEGKLDKYLKDF